MCIKDFLIGAGTLLVGVALGAAICCMSKCDKKCGKPQPPCPMEQMQQPQQPQGPQCPKGPQCQGPEKPACPQQEKCCFVKLAEELHFSDEQMAQFKVLQDEQKAKMDADKEAFKTAFEALLTDEQKAQLKK